jgi:sugar O-acyltransferase (sialic acid O-acetyltransferase NeuD family)
VLLIKGRVPHRATVFIAGAGGLAREVYSWLLPDLRAAEGVTFGGFVVDDPSANATVSNGLPGPCLSIADAARGGSAGCFVLAVGRPVDRRGLFERMVNAGLRAATLVHPSVIMGEAIRFGEGVVVCPAASLTTAVTVGDGVLINVGTRIGHDVTIGAFTSLLGNNTINGDVRIGEDVLLGAGSLIHPGVVVESRAVIGMGSVVIRSVPVETTVFGNPAMRVSRG